MPRIAVIVDQVAGGFGLEIAEKQGPNASTDLDDYDSPSLIAPIKGPPVRQRHQASLP
jgi:hypothetical protein